MEFWDGGEDGNEAIVEYDWALISMCSFACRLSGKVLYQGRYVVLRCSVLREKRKYKF